MIDHKPLDAWRRTHPLLDTLIAAKETCWSNPGLRPFDQVRAALPLDRSAMEEAAARLQRFAPWVARAYPETAARDGLIESPLVAIPRMQQLLAPKAGPALPGRLLLKRDDALPISGSIKARGGIYEVFKHAETLAIEAGLLTEEDDYRRLDDPDCRALFADHSIQVGSTGNLGLSIGLIGARLGFRVGVHMSSDAREWKKALLRRQGVEVIEYSADYSAAVAEGRRRAESTPRCHFIDDENSRDLFLGYSVAALRLQAQLTAQGIRVDADHPLFVYLPCGVGGGPGGVAFGLKQLFGDHVHCFFAEPTHSPCMLLGLYTGLHDRISVGDIGLDNRTCADGLAVGRPSAFVGRVMAPLLAGLYTVSDDRLYRLLAQLQDSEEIALEPSALAGVPGIARLLGEGRDYLAHHDLLDSLPRATHIAWATGGGMVPADAAEADYRRGQALLTPR